jgi:hypothetical protein
VSRSPSKPKDDKVEQTKRFIEARNAAKPYNDKKIGPAPPAAAMSMDFRGELSRGRST